MPSVVLGAMKFSVTCTSVSRSVIPFTSNDGLILYIRAVKTFSRRPSPYILRFLSASEMVQSLNRPIMMGTRIGMLTPSSNTVLEPLVGEMFSQLCKGIASVHFSRFRVQTIGMSSDAQAQFDLAGMMAAVQLLRDAHCDVIMWNGTSGSFLGYDQDKALCAAIEATGARASTSVLAVNDYLESHGGIHKIGLVTPFNDDVQAAIVAQYESIGYIVVAERHLGLSDNHLISQVTTGEIKSMADQVMAQQPEALVMLCTNMKGPCVVADLERQYGIPVLDSICTAVWKSLLLAEIDTTALRNWGKIFNS